MLKEKVNNIEGKIDDHIIEQRKDFEKVFDKLDSLNNKFAGKWVERVTAALLIAILGSLATVIIGGLL